MYVCRTSRLYEPPTKKLKTVECGEDRISKLPDETIAQILSGVPTKYAVRTSALSRDWRYKWTSIYDINIEDNYRVEVEGTSFVRFVDRVLDLTRNSKIKSFRLLSVNMTDPYKTSIWITAILGRGIQKLEIEACNVQGYLPRCFTDCCTTLEELKVTLRRGILAVFVNCFPNLKILYLDGKAEGFEIMNPRSTRTAHMVLNFPVLQVLELRYYEFSNVESVEIHAPELITFNSYGIEKELNDYKIKVWGPKLSKFCSRHGFLYNFDLHAPSVYYMDLTHGSLPRSKSIESLAPRANAILKGVPGLACLKISNSIVQALLRERRLVLPTLDQVKRLEVTSSDAKSLLEFLQLMPNLESLNILYGPRPDYKFNRDREEPLPLCVVSHLRKVEFNGFRGQRSQYDHINLFLEHAMKLERVFVYLDRTSGVTNRDFYREFTSSKSSASITFSRGIKYTPF